MSNKSLFFRVGLVLFIASGLIFGSVTTVHAAEIVDGGSIPSGQTIQDDVLIGGENVTVDGTIEGNLIAAGQTVMLTGHVTGDAMLFGAEVTVAEGAVIDGNLFLGASAVQMNGTVTGSIFGGSASIVFGQNAVVDRNVYYGGYSLETLRGSQIGIDLFSGSYQAILDGVIQRDATIGAGAIELNGTIGGDARFDVEAPDQYTPNMQYWTSPDMPQLPQSIPTGLRISDSAVISGTLTYTSPVDQSSAFHGSIQSGSVVFQTPVPEESGSAAAAQTARQSANPFQASHWVGSMFQRMITLLLLGFLILWLAPQFIKRPVEELVAKPGWSVLYGFVAAAISPLALIFILLFFIFVGIVFVIISIGGLTGPWFVVLGSALTLAMVLFFFLMFTGSIIVTAYLIGSLIFKQFSSEKDANRFVIFLVGVSVYVLVTAIPFLGFLIKIAAGLFGFGAIILALWPKSKTAIVEPAPVQ